jgi:glucose 1-dehydrogenase
MGILDNKVAVVTGGSRGLGLAIAKTLAREGASVVIASRSQKSVAVAVEQIKAAGGKAAGLALDIADMAQVKDLGAFAVKTFGHLDIWVNNAGTAGPYGSTLDFSPEAFNQVIQTNIVGTYNGSRVAMGYFIPQHAGKLINLMGAGWNNPVPYQNAYASSKVWIRWFTKALAQETQGSGVSVIAVNPGMVLTELLTHIEVFESAQARLDRFPMIVRVLAKPPEVPAARIAKLASSATDGKTGLEVSLVNPVNLWVGFLKEGLRGLFKRPEPPSNIKTTVVPPDQS